MKPPLEYRPTNRPPKIGTVLTVKNDTDASITVNPADVLAHKRALKAAQMRRYRAKKKETP